MKLTSIIIGLFRVPVKLMETMVTSTIDTHVTRQGLRNPHQWAYKKGHSTELLLVKITDDWRRALDMKYAVDEVFVAFRKAFDASPHSVLLRKNQSWHSWRLMVLNNELSLWRNTSDNDYDSMNFSFLFIG